MILRFDGSLAALRRWTFPVWLGLASSSLLGGCASIAKSSAAPGAAIGNADPGGDQAQGAPGARGAPAVEPTPAEAAPETETAQGEEASAAPENENAEGAQESCPGCEGEADDAEAEAEVRTDSASADQTLRYTADLSDAEIERRFVHDPDALGSVSVGFVDQGRLLNGVRMPSGDTWEVTSPDRVYGTAETIQALEEVANAVHAAQPQAARLRINRISKKEGGYARPHRSHQNGRDVDLGLFYKLNRGPGDIRGPRERAMDPAYNWAVVRSLVTLTDVQFILVDRRIQKVLYDYALSIGENRAWLDSLFRGEDRLLKHARGHRDHFHVRFFCPRSQELGRRVQPLLARRRDENFMQYRVRRGDNLGHIARRFGSSVKLIQRANHLTSSFLRVSRVLVIPLRGPCTHCPVPGPVIVPPRRLPPDRTPVAGVSGAPRAPDEPGAPAASAPAASPNG